MADTCQGDSGGPLWRGDKLYGVTSWGLSCAGGLPGFYSDVRVYTDFIETTMAGGTYVYPQEDDGLDTWVIVSITLAGAVVCLLLGLLIYRLSLSSEVKMSNEDPATYNASAV